MYRIEKNLNSLQSMKKPVCETQSKCHEKSKPEVLVTHREN